MPATLAQNSKGLPFVVSLFSGVDTGKCPSVHMGIFKGHCEILQNTPKALPPHTSLKMTKMGSTATKNYFCCVPSHCDIRTAKVETPLIPDPCSGGAGPRNKARFLCFHPFLLPHEGSMAPQMPAEGKWMDLGSSGGNSTIAGKADPMLRPRCPEVVISL